MSETTVWICPNPWTRDKSADWWERSEDILMDEETKEELHYCWPRKLSMQQSSWSDRLREPPKSKPHCSWLKMTWTVFHVASGRRNNPDSWTKPGNHWPQNSNHPCRGRPGQGKTPVADGTILPPGVSSEHQAGPGQPERGNVERNCWRKIN